MTDQNADLFSGDTSPQDNPTATEGADLFSTLVGEGKKFKTQEDLAKSRVEQDRFIEQLKTENAEMRRELERSSKITAVDDALKRLNDRLENASETNDGTPSTMSREDILAIVRDDAFRQKAEENRRAVQASLVNKLGDADKVREFLRTRSAELGMTLDDLKGMVERAPQAASTLLGLNVQPSGAKGPTHTPTTTRNTTAEAGIVGARNKSYYDNLKKEMGTAFWKPAVQQQLFKDRVALGEEFYK